jgi:alanyl-tRNA synthetase
MLTVKQIRQKFLDFFRERQHKIVPAAPIVNQNDPTLMFVNSGMAQFKDFFLGNQVPSAARIADTQKCLRVSGKHNDLEDVGMDGTHHTMFEMLGNWSFGDYFKEEAIRWSWELLTKEYNLAPERLYATVFGGDATENLAADEEAKALWLRYLPEDHILYGNKKDNFWEMGDTGPCGPCSEIHVDMRSEAERAAVHGSELVNQDHPLVVEIWNNVFMQFERLWNAEKGGSAALVEFEKSYKGERDSKEFKQARTQKHTEVTYLKELSAKHVDTGMGFERLCMVLEGKTATYDTGVFRPLISFIEEATGIKYTGSYERSAKSDIAMRVLSDHIRAVVLIIADGQLPSSTGAGYVLRRILRRAVRYYYSFLGCNTPLLYRLLPLVADMFDGTFDEVRAQENFITNVVKGEEESFLRTLSSGLRRLDEIQVSNNTLDGQTAFELYDTYGFPIDLTKLIASERGWLLDEEGFEQALAEQKRRSREDAQKEAGNWVELLPNFTDFQFVGYDNAETLSKIVKYRTVKTKGETQMHIALDQTPFYPEGGGQVGDTGFLIIGGDKLEVLDTRKENNLVLHVVPTLPEDPTAPVKAVIDSNRRRATAANHSATHLIHAALRQVLGTHVQQKGSLVNSDYLRFDFAHFQKVSDEELLQIEQIVNAKIRENIALQEERDLPIETAKTRGAMMLFGEKYGETVRLITFDSNYSKELCGGCHVARTGDIGFCKITSESSIQAGVRRIEAITGIGAEKWISAQTAQIQQLSDFLKAPASLSKAVADLQENNRRLQKEIELLQLAQASIAKTQLLAKVETIGSRQIQFIGAVVDISNKDAIKHLCSELHQALPNVVLVIGNPDGDKASLTVSMNRDFAKAMQLNAGQIIKTIATHIDGGGGGQPFLATAGGKNPNGLQAAIDQARQLLN